MAKNGFLKFVQQAETVQTSSQPLRRRLAETGKKKFTQFACNTNDNGHLQLTTFWAVRELCAKHYAGHCHKPVFLVHNSQMSVKTRHDVTD